MARTHSFFAQDTPFPDGVIFLGPHKFAATTGAATLASTGHGNLSLGVAASTSVVLIATLDDIIAVRTGYLDVIEEEFGNQKRGPGDFRGYPPLSTANLYPTSQGYWPKGLKINNVALVYSVAGAALTAHTLGLTTTQFANNAAAVVTNIIAQAANGLATAVQANPYVTVVNVAAPEFVVTDDTQYQLEVDVTTPAASTYDLYGAFIHTSFNFN